MIPVGHNLFPDVFLAGTPKSGTTFLFDLLIQHAKVQGSAPKEPNFYMDEDNPHNQNFKPLPKANYVECFEPIDQNKLQIDGTTLSIYQESLLNKLKGADKFPKIVVAIREPAMRIRSAFYYTKNNRSAISGITFSQYVDLLLASDFQEIAKHCKSKRYAHSMQHELLYSCYVIFLKKWQEIVGDDNLKLIVFEKLIAKPLEVCNEVLAFLELLPLSDIETVESNETVGVRNSFLHFYLYKFYERLGFRLPFKPMLKKIYSILQFKDRTADDEDLQGLERLRIYFEPLNRELVNEFDLDLGIWE